MKMYEKLSNLEIQGARFIIKLYDFMNLMTSDGSSGRYFEIY